MNANSLRLVRAHAELQELSIVLDTAGPFFTEARGARLGPQGGRSKVWHGRSD